MSPKRVNNASGHAMSLRNGPGLYDENVTKLCRVEVLVFEGAFDGLERRWRKPGSLNRRSQITQTPRSSGSSRSPTNGLPGLATFHSSAGYHVYPTTTQ
jgi:hypothetical protein